MARKSHTKTFESEFAAIVAAAQVARTMDPAFAADLKRRSSGASGAHSDSNSRTRRAAGRTNRVGSRSSARNAAVRDHS